MKTYSTAAMLCAAWLAAGCGSEEGGPCVVGQTAACPCLGGASGVQVCASGGTFGACMCPDAGPSDAVSERPGDGGAADAVPEVAALDATADRSGLDAADGSAGDAMGPWDPCATGSLIDLNARGTMTGNVTRFVGDTSAAGPDSPLRSPCTPRTAHQVVLRYVPRAAGALRVSTANVGTAESFDTVAWAQNRCASLRPDMAPLGCNDNGNRAPLTRAAEFDVPSVTPGAPVFIVVAGSAPPSAPWTDRGAFVLTVTEVLGVPTGAACDPSGVMNFCLADSVCARVGGVSTCAAPGARGGRCQVGDTPCDERLRCRGMGGEATSRCRATVFAGGNCDLSENADECFTGSTCVMGSSFSLCVPDGWDGARCLAGGTCNPGLACDASNRCREALEAGSACDPARIMNVCVTGSSCIAGETSGRCVRDGLPGGRCRTGAGVSPCDRGLVCMMDRCRLAE
jgi:hypothetical protein